MPQSSSRVNFDNRKTALSTDSLTQSLRQTVDSVFLMTENRLVHESDDQKW